MNTATERHKIDLMHRSASETAARSLDVLSAIDQTIDSLRWLSDRADADATFLEREIETLRTATPVTYLDPTGSRGQSLDDVRGTIEQVCKQFIDKRNAAITAPELSPDDGVVDAYTETINSLADLHDALNDLRWAVMLHDGQLDTPSGNPTNSVDDLFARVGV
jgi:hypothetical protein